MTMSNSGCFGFGSTCCNNTCTFQPHLDPGSNRSRLLVQDQRFWCPQDRPAHFLCLMCSKKKISSVQSDVTRPMRHVNDHCTNTFYSCPPADDGVAMVTGSLWINTWRTPWRRAADTSQTRFNFKKHHKIFKDRHFLKTWTKVLFFLTKQWIRSTVVIVTVVVNSSKHLNSQHHNGQSPRGVNVRLQVGDHRRVATLWAQTHGLKPPSHQQPVSLLTPFTDVNMSWLNIHASCFSHMMPFLTFDPSD